MQNFAMEEFDRENPLFEGVLPFRLSLAEKDVRPAELTVRVLEGSRSSTKPARTLCIEVADELDAFFLHSLVVGEAEFASLKEEQSILVDFAAFHANFIELLRECSAARGQQQPKFYCLLSSRDSSPGATTVLSIIETNQFKQLTHLQLSLRSGNDASIKKYLAARLRHTQGELAKVSAMAKAAAHDAAKSKAAADSTAVELARARASEESSEARIRSEAARSAMELREAMSTDRACLERDLNAKLADTQARLENQIFELRKRNDELSHHRTTSTSTIAQLEGTVRDQQSQLRMSESSLASSAEECNSAKSSLKTASSQVVELHKQLTASETKVAVQGQKITDLVELLSAREAQVKGSDSSKAQVEASLGHYKESFQKQHTKLELMEKEILKANNIIEGLSEELKAAKNKSKAKSEAARASEDRISERDRATLQLQRDLDSLQFQLEKEKSANSNSTSQVEMLKKQLVDARETIERSQQVIAFLNKEITEINSPPVPSKLGNNIRVPAASTRIRLDGSANAFSRNQLSTSSGNPLSPSVSQPLLSTAVTSTAPSSNPYLSGTIPLKKALEDLQIKEMRSSYFKSPASQSFAQIPGGGPEASY